LPAAELHQVVRNLAAIDLPCIAVEAEIASPMLSAGIRTAADVDSELADKRVRLGLQRGGQRVAKVHGFGQRQVAGISARARHDVINFMHAQPVEANAAQAAMQTLQVR